MNTNRNFQSTLPLPRAAFLDTVGSKRGGVKVGNKAEVNETAVAVRGTKGMSVVFGIACVVRRSPEETVETPSGSTESSREDVSLVEFDPSVCAFRIVKYAE